MKISNALFINAIFILLITSCKNPAGERTISHKSSQATGIHPAFFDKVLAQDTLSYGLLSKCVKIDRASLDEKAVFTGDTIYFINTARPILVIDAHTPVCTYKYIFVYDNKPPGNKEAILAGIDCDEDFDADYTRSKFKIVNDSTIYVETEDSERKPDNQTKITVTGMFYGISKNDKIHLLRSTAPKVSYDVTDE